MRATAIVTTLGLGLVLAGCEKPAPKPAEKPPEAAPPAASTTPPAAPETPATPPAPPENPAKASLLERLTTELVDAKKALAANPKLIVKEKNEFKANDPITYTSKAWFAGVSTVQIAALKHEVELLKNLDDKFQYPSFEQFSEMLKRNNVKLNGLYRWQVYGYDSTDGAIVILEDPDKKKAEYEKAGLDPNAAP